MSQPNASPSQSTFKPLDLTLRESAAAYLRANIDSSENELQRHYRTQMERQLGGAK
jgi:hypothetical protein